MRPPARWTCISCHFPRAQACCPYPLLRRPLIFNSAGAAELLSVQHTERNTGGALTANKSARAVRGPPPNTPLLHGPPRPSRRRHSPCLCVGLGAWQSVGYAPSLQPRKATCDQSADASHQAIAHASPSTAIAMRSRFSGPPSRIRRTRHGENQAGYLCRAKMVTPISRWLKYFK